MKPYDPPLDGRSAYDGMLLDFNERTQAPSKRVIRALEKFVKDQTLHRYPEYLDLEREIATYAGVAPTEVMITNGSDQGIDIVFRTFTEKGDTVIIPSPSFALFAQCARVNGNRIIAPLYHRDALSFPLKEILKITDRRVKLVVVCNPNNPTGTPVSVIDIARIAQRARGGIILVDEAYWEFSGMTVVPLMKKYPNVIITRTFSKAFGLASLRIGYIIAAPTYIAEMKKVRGPYDVNMAAYYAAHVALVDRKSVARYADHIMRKAKPLVENFFAKNGITFYASAGNFILFRPSDPSRTEEALQRNGILVRPQNQPPIEGTLRVSIGTTAQMRKFITTYRNKCLPVPYAFIDRDGTLIFEPQDTYQIDSLDKLRVLPGVTAGLRRLKAAGYRLVLVTNQDGLGTPSFPKRDFAIPHNAFTRILARSGIRFDVELICPHFPRDRCACRKPKTTLVDQFLESQGTIMDRVRSFVCGDRESDRKLAKNLGVRFIPMITNGRFPNINTFS